MKVLKLESEKISIEVIPEKGAKLNALMLKRGDDVIEIIDGYKTPEEIIENEGSKSSILAPFPNRIADGKFEFNGDVYQFPINMPEENNAIHGFIEHEGFEVVSDEKNEYGGRLALRHTYPGDKAYFPFPFSLDVIYELSENTLTCTVNVTNNGSTELPFGLGWHPYFRTGILVNELGLQIPEVEEIEVDDRLIPTGKKVKSSHFEKLEKIGVKEFDTGYAFQNPRNQVLLIDEKNDVAISIETDEGYGYLQIYTPPHRESIAIEPMTCSADAFNNKDGLRIVNPGEVISHSFSIKVT